MSGTYEKAAAYGIPGRVVDGITLEVYSAVLEARVARSSGLILLKPKPTDG